MNFFDDGSPYLTHPLLTAERTNAELDRIDELIGGLDPDSLVLDLGCGFGRHCLALADRGYRVVGTDPSETMIAAADASSSARSSTKGTVEFVLGSPEVTGRRLAPASFDLALCLFTTFGQQCEELPQEASTTDLLRVAAKLLKPGGSLVVEVPELERAVAMLVANEQLGPTAVFRSFDPATAVLHERFETPTETFDLAYQLFDEPSLHLLLDEAGFDVSTSTDSALVPPPPTFMTVVARRR